MGKAKKSTGRVTAKKERVDPPQPVDQVISFDDLSLMGLLDPKDIEIRKLQARVATLEAELLDWRNTVIILRNEVESIHGQGQAAGNQEDGKVPEARGRGTGSKSKAAGAGKRGTRPSPAG